MVMLYKGGTKLKILMLRAQITNDNEKYMCHSKLEDEDDFYVLLINQLLTDNLVSDAEVWYYGKRKPDTIYSSGLRLRYNNLEGNYKPDIIFARGGFPEYTKVFEKYPNVLKVYYGAGSRYLPLDGIYYDVILTDSEKRIKEINRHYENSNAYIFRKGCAEHLFKYKKIKKLYDIGNVTSIPTNKGQNTIGTALKNTNLKFINIGQFAPNTVKTYKKFGINVSFTGRLPRRLVSQFVRQCRFIFVGDHWRAGCPRVIPECMSLGVPIILLDDIPVSEIYIPNFFTIRTTKGLLRETILNLNNFEYNPTQIVDYYRKNFNLKKCAKIFYDQVVG